MLTLYEISNQIPYQEKSLCIFEQLDKCSVNREFGIVCQEHAKQIFGIDLMKTVLVLPTGESQYHSLVSTQDRKIFLPFPYEFKEDVEAKPCLNETKLDESIDEYVEQMKTIPSALIAIIKSVLRTSISDGTLYDPELPQAPYNFHVFSNQKVRSYLLNRWKNCWVIVQRTLDDTLRFDEYPVEKLPVFYQIMLMYLTMHDNVLETTTNSETNNTRQLLVPRIILNADEYCFKYINEDELLLLRGDATHATPLVLAGKQMHNKNIKVFQQSKHQSNSLTDNLSLFPL